MKRLLPLALVPALLLAGWVALDGAGDPFYLGGIQVNEPDHEAWVESLDEAGLDTVAVTVYAHQGDWDSANLWFDDEAPWVLNEIRVARERGLEVVLVLRVALDHAFEANRFLWHGMMMPRGEELIEEWFRRYRAFALRWARLAEAEGVDVLAIASEMNALTNTVPVDELPVLEEYWTNEEKVEREKGRVMEHAAALEERSLPVHGSDGYERLEPYIDDKNRAHAAWARQIAFAGEADALERINRRRALLDAHWRELIAAMRGEYSGSLTYAANFDQYRFVAFWEALDLIAVNAYFPLRRHLLPGGRESDLLPVLEAGWRGHLHALDSFRRERGIPDHRVLFTEIGYVQRANCTIEPWAASGYSVVPTAEGSELLVWDEQPVDRHERALAIRALHRAHLELGGDLLAGLLYWKLSSVPSHAEVEPFVLLIGERAPPDPLLEELRHFAPPSPVDRLRQRLAAVAHRIADRLAGVAAPAWP